MFAVLLHDVANSGLSSSEDEGAVSVQRPWEDAQATALCSLPSLWVSKAAWVRRLCSVRGSTASGETPLVTEFFSLLVSKLLLMKVCSALFFPPPLIDPGVQEKYLEVTQAIPTLRDSALDT